MSISVLRYKQIATEDRLAWADLPELVAAARAFLDPVLAGEVGTWDAASRTWRVAG